MVAEAPQPDPGFETEVRQARVLCEQWLVEQGLTGGEPVFVVCSCSAGSSIWIDNVPATGTREYAGPFDHIDRHTWRLLKGVALSTLLGVGTELTWGDDDNDLVGAVREAAQQSGARGGDQLGKAQSRHPADPHRASGGPLRVVVHKDIVLRPWQESGS